MSLFLNAYRWRDKSALYAPEPIISAGLVNGIEGERCEHIGPLKKSL